MNRILLHLLLLGMSLAGLTACTEKDYITDGGLHTAKSNLTTYDYLKNHPYHSFDTLVMAIDHFKLKDEVNRAGTFFAPTDYSILRYDFDGKIELESLFRRMTADSIRQYMFTERIQMSDFANDIPKIYKNQGNTRWQIAIGKERQTAQQWNQWSGAPVDFFYLTRVRGTLDVPAGSGDDARSRCQTQGIETTTGMLHALENRHVFIRFQ